MSKKIELVQAIGNEVCEGCGPDADCGDEPEECGRIANALDLLNNYIFTSAHEGASKGRKGHKEFTNEYFPNPTAEPPPTPTAQD